MLLFSLMALGCRFRKCREWKIELILTVTPDSFGWRTNERLIINNLWNCDHIIQVMCSLISFPRHLFNRLLMIGKEKAQ